MSESINWRVLKFGGTSVSSASRWKSIKSLIHQCRAENTTPFLVCSALAGVSNLLEQAVYLVRDQKDPQDLVDKIYQLHHQLAQTLEIELPRKLNAKFMALSDSLTALRQRPVTPADQAEIMAYGELMSTLLGQAWLDSQGVTLNWYDARQLLQSDPQMATQSSQHFLTAQCPYQPDAELQDLLQREASFGVITQGFIARDPDGQTVLLGRGGSDTSAAYFAAKLEAQALEIWTDVPGIFTANPRSIPSARMMPHLTYTQAETMAYLGAKVLHPRSLAPARTHQIPMAIRSTDMPEYPGTQISENHPLPEHGSVQAVASSSALCLISISNQDPELDPSDFVDKVTQLFCEHAVPMDALNTSAGKIQVTLNPLLNAVDKTDIQTLIQALNQFCDTEINYSAASVSLIGHELQAGMHKIGPALEHLEPHQLRLMMHGAHQDSLTLVLQDQQTEGLMKALHQELIATQPDYDDLGASWQSLHPVSSEKLMSTKG